MKDIIMVTVDQGRIYTIFWGGGLGGGRWIRNVGAWMMYCKPPHELPPRRREVLQNTACVVILFTDAKGNQRYEVVDTERESVKGTRSRKGLAFWATMPLPQGVPGGLVSMLGLSGYFISCLEGLLS